MKGLILRSLLTAAAVLGVINAFAAQPAVRDISIDVSIDREGTATIVEKWDATVTSGTEYYLPRYNLGDIWLSDLSVSENGSSFVLQKGWDIHASISQKAHTCGLNYVTEGVEICWGIGNYGDHEWTVSYKMHNAVKSLEDYDMLHLQLVNPGLSSPPEHVSVSISVSGKTLDLDNTLLWGFGFDGTDGIENGKVVYESHEGLGRNDSVIVLLRFNKGIVENPQSIRKGVFQDVLDKALEGSNFGAREDDDSGIDPGLVLFTIFAVLTMGLPLWIRKRQLRKNREKYLGTKDMKSIMWSRETPFGGDVTASSFVLGEVAAGGTPGQTAAAMILRMIDSGAISVRKDEKDKIELVLESREKAEGLGVAVSELWDMIYDASGSDHILQDKEFGRWSNRNAARVSNWVKAIKSDGASIVSSKFSSKLPAEGRKLIGLKSFLEDYTLIKERSAGEVVLWKEYLVFGSLLGIADKVAKELKDINPREFEECTRTFGDYNTTTMVLRQSDTLGRNIVSAKSRYDAQRAAAAASSRAGRGGYTSFGGGGGFSGGGFGGGSR